MERSRSKNPIFLKEHNYMGIDENATATKTVCSLKIKSDIYLTHTLFIKILQNTILFCIKWIA
jgi:hypothetical protein